jgi:hypothetical protein
MGWFWLDFIGRPSRFGCGTVVLVPLPVVIWGIWNYLQTPISSDDDVTGIATGVLMLVGIAGIVVGVILRRSLRSVLTRTR